MNDQHRDGTTATGEPYVVIRTGATVTLHIGLGAEPSTFEFGTEPEAVKFFDQAVKKMSKP